MTLVLSIYLDGHLRLSETTTEDAMRANMDTIADQVTELRRRHRRVAVTGEADGVTYIIPVNRS